MEEQGNNLIQDLPVWRSHESPDQIRINTMPNSSWVTANGDQLGERGFKKGKFGAVLISEEELKIRGELEIEVERDLEEEIKDDIIHLALRLHRLYQHQKDRDMRDQTTFSGEPQSKIKSSIFTEVSITIRMEAGSKVEIHETKKEIREKGRLKNIKLDYKQSNMSPNAKEFNWERTLRSGTCSSVSINRKQEVSRHGRTPRNNNGAGPEAKHGIRDRKNNTNAHGHGKERVSARDNKMLQLGWRR
ncbi:uncharacterized protein LOC143849121 isoform X2 [Tasmannia lanceolata]|uniref:uncharacterized protein LOC143849121 isoform X2 n=1 Tax=Tasmannia lanceolata TaxID=3420 RepID=UPI004062E530